MWWKCSLQDVSPGGHLSLGRSRVSNGLKRVDQHFSCTVGISGCHLSKENQAYMCDGRTPMIVAEMYKDLCVLCNEQLE